MDRNSNTGNWHCKRINSWFLGIPHTVLSIYPFILELLAPPHDHLKIGFFSSRAAVVLMNRSISWDREE